MRGYLIRQKNESNLEGVPAYARTPSQVGHFRRPSGTLLNCRDDFQGKGGTFFGHQPGHFYIDEHTMAGVSIKEVQELMGHRSFETTLQYAHLAEDHVKQQVMKLPFASYSGNSRTRTGHAKPILADNMQKE